MKVSEMYGVHIAKRGEFIRTLEQAGLSGSLIVETNPSNMWSRIDLSSDFGQMER